MTASNFDASKYLTDLRGRDYLEVKWRLLWLRTEHPDAAVETELVSHEAGLALFRAKVALRGGGSATGWGSETAEDFEDYIEKAETKALGRALAALGFGTQFCEDFDFSAERQARRDDRGAEGVRHSSRVVDAPVRRRELKALRDRAPESATSAQVKAIYGIARDAGSDDDAVEGRSRALFGAAPAELSKRQASRFIELLRRAEGGREQAVEEGSAVRQAAAPV